MIDNWYDAIEIAKMKNESIRNDVLKIRMKKKDKDVNSGHSALSIVVLGNLGKAISSIGNSLQSHYHSEYNRKNMRKVS
jgi:hypothetical protein